MIILNTNPLARSFLTTEFWFSAGVGAVIVFIVNTVFGIADQAVTDVLVKLLATAATGIGAILTLGAIAVNMYSKKIDLKTAMINQGLVPEVTDLPVDEVLTPPTAPVVTPEVTAG